MARSQERLLAKASSRVSDVTRPAGCVFVAVHIYLHERAAMQWAVSACSSQFEVVRPLLSSNKRPLFKTPKCFGRNKTMVMGPDGT
jgi:hypothetical protein